MATPAMQDYLKAIYQLEQSGEAATTSVLAERLGVTPASATNMVKRLSEGRLVTHEPYQGARLTRKGERLALSVLRHHRLIEQFLVEHLGMGWDEVHDEAEVLEHHISDALAARIAEVLGHPSRDPHGDPIPSADGDIERDDGSPLSEAEHGQRLRLVRVGRQDPELLRLLGEHGLFPAAELEVMAKDASAGVIQLSTGEGALHLGLDVAATIIVEEVNV